MMYVRMDPLMDVDTSCMKPMNLYMMYPHPSWMNFLIHRVIKYIGTGCTSLIGYDLISGLPNANYLRKIFSCFVNKNQ